MSATTHKLEPFVGTMSARRIATAAIVLVLAGCGGTSSNVAVHPDNANDFVQRMHDKHPAVIDELCDRLEGLPTQQWQLALDIMEGQFEQLDGPFSGKEIASSVFAWCAANRWRQ